MRMLKHHHRASGVVVPVSMSTILGATPQVYLHADDLVGADESAVGAWTGRTTHNATGVSSPTLQYDGYDGTRRSVRTTSAGAYVAMHDAAADYPSSRSPFFWALACNVATGTTARDLIALASSDNIYDYQRIALSATTDDVQALGRGGQFNFSTLTGDPVTEAVPSIVAVTYDGDRITVIQRTSGGDAVLIDDELHDFSAPTADPFNRFALGAFVRSTSAANATMDARCFVALANATVDLATAGQAMDYLENQDDCPV